MPEIILAIYAIIGALRAMASFGIFYDTESGIGMFFVNLFAVTYCNKDKLTKFGFVLAILADLIFLPGALAGSIVYLVAKGITYLINKFCIKQK